MRRGRSTARAAPDMSPISFRSSIRGALTAAGVLMLGVRAWAAPTDVYFSPEGGGTDAVVRELRGARKTVHVQAFSFTSVPIAKALVEATKRQVSVVVIFDKGILEEPHTAVDLLVKGEVPRFIDSEHTIAHNKVMVIDGSTVITGSFNFTAAAEHHNAENLLVIHDAELAAKYESNWNLHRQHSTPYPVAGEESAPKSSRKRSRNRP